MTRPRTLATISATVLAGTLVVWSTGAPAQATDPPPVEDPTCQATLLTINGTPGDDVLVGGKAAEKINGFGGNDTITGGGGADTIRGGIGNDTINGEVGSDCLFGDIGDDDVFGEDGDDYLDGGAGIDDLFGGLGSDTCVWREGDLCVDIEWIRY